MTHDEQESRTLLRDAVAHGLVTAADVAAGRARVEALAGRHRVHRIDVAGLAVAYVKHADAAAPDSDDRLAAEAQTLRRLAGRAPVPVLLAHDAGSVWTAPVSGVALGLLGTRPDLLDRAAAGLGRALAELHWSVLDVNTPAAPMPWPLRWTGRPLRSTLREAAACWRTGVRDTGTWVHGDVSSTNVIVAGAGGDRPGRVSLIDLEAAGQGDPGWDVACAEATLADTDRRPDRRSIMIFRAAYAAAGGLGQPTRGLREVRDLMTSSQDSARLGHAA